MGNSDKLLVGNRHGDCSCWSGDLVGNSDKLLVGNRHWNWRCLSGDLGETVTSCWWGIDTGTGVVGVGIWGEL